MLIKSIHIIVLVVVIMLNNTDATLSADFVSNRKNDLFIIFSTNEVNDRGLYSKTTPLRIEIPGETWSFGLEIGSSGANIQGLPFKINSQGLYSRWFQGDTLNILIGLMNRKFSSNEWFTYNASSSRVTYNVKTEINELTLALGNQWIFPPGYSFGVDWIMWSLPSSKTTSTVISGTTDSTSDAKLKKYTKLSSAGTLRFYYGFSF